MTVLIVESQPDLGSIWKSHLARRGLKVQLEYGQYEAEQALRARHYDIMILDVVIARGSAFAIADLVNWLHPKMRIIFVTANAFFSDGSIFNLSSNACAYMQTNTPPDDLAAMVEHYSTPAEVTKGIFQTC